MRVYLDLPARALISYASARKQQVMHFKYDQNLELHNGIHAAIRGKLLEATFAPVWVEPLESAVLGYGHGEQGATTAQTFALSGISGPNVKRQRILHVPGTRSLTLSMLFSSYCKLYDGCNTFLATLRGVHQMAQAANDPVTGAYRVAPQMRQELQTLMAEYYQFRMEKARLDKESIAGVTKPAETELVRKIGTIRRSIDDMTYFKDNNTVKVDLFVYSYLYNAFLADGVYPERFIGLMTLVWTNIVVRASNNAGKHLYFLSDQHMPSNGFDAAQWRARAFFAFGVLSALTWGEMGYVDANTAPDLKTSYGNLDPPTWIEVLLTHADKMDSSTWSAEDMMRTAVCVMPFFTVSEVLHDAKTTILANQNSIMKEYLSVSVASIKDMSKGIPTSNAQVTLMQPKEFENFASSINTLRRSVWNMRGIGFGHVIGSYIGSMFSSAVNHCAYHGVFNSTGRAHNPGFSNPLYGVYDEANPNATWKSRLWMMYSARHLMTAGTIIGSNMEAADLSDENVCIRSMALALYLVHLFLLEDAEQYSIHDVLTDESNAKNLFTRLEEKDVDLEAKCTNALRFSREYRKASLGLANDRARIAEMRRICSRIYPSSTSYAMKKLECRIYAYYNATSPMSGGDDTGNGMLHGSLVFDQLYQALGKGHSTVKGNVYTIISQAICFLDRPKVWSSRGNLLAGGNHTSLASEIHADGQVSLVTGSSIQDETTGEENDATDPPEHATRQAQTPQPVLLGSILLQSSEKRMDEVMGTASASTGVDMLIGEDVHGKQIGQQDEQKQQQQEQHTASSAEMHQEDEQAQENANASSPTAAQPASSEDGTGATTASGSKQGKKGFKKVSARLL